MSQSISSNCEKYVQIIIINIHCKWEVKDLCIITYHQQNIQM